MFRQVLYIFIVISGGQTERQINRQTDLGIKTSNPSWILSNIVFLIPVVSTLSTLSTLCKYVPYINSTLSWFIEPRESNLLGCETKSRDCMRYKSCLRTMLWNLIYLFRLLFLVLSPGEMM